MTVADNAPVEQNLDSVSQENQSQSTTTDVKPKDFVAYETHRRLLDERKRDLEKLRALEAKEREREELEARKRGDYEALIKARDEALKAKEEELGHIKNMITSASKKSAVVDALGGNIDSKWHRLIDVSEIVVNPDTGEVDSLSVAKVAESFKREFPEAIKRAGSLPSHAPQGLQNGDGKILRSEWLKLPPKEMLKWKPEQITN